MSESVESACLWPPDSSKLIEKLIIAADHVLGGPLNVGANKYSMRKLRIGLAMLTDVNKTDQSDETDQSELRVLFVRLFFI